MLLWRKRRRGRALGVLDAVLSGQSVRALRRGHLSRAMKEVQE